MAVFVPLGFDPFCLVAPVQIILPCGSKFYIGWYAQKFGVQYNVWQENGFCKDRKYDCEKGYSLVQWVLFWLLRVHPFFIYGRAWLEFHSTVVVVCLWLMCRLLLICLLVVAWLFGLHYFPFFQHAIFCSLKLQVWLHSSLESVIRDICKLLVICGVDLMSFHISWNFPFPVCTGPVLLPRLGFWMGLCMNLPLGFIFTLIVLHASAWFIFLLLLLIPMSLVDIQKWLRANCLSPFVYCMIS